MTDELIQQAARLLRDSRQPSVLTGSGVSRESGIPTFRDALEGLWEQYDPRQLATAPAFQANPKLVWDFYTMRREKAVAVKPNTGHEALAKLEQHFGELPIITQNIDDLHEQAGSTHVIHLHGILNQNKCFYDCQGEPTLIDISKLEYDTKAGPPGCPHCGRWIRPNVVWFGEMLPPEALAECKRIVHTTDVMLVIGTSGVVYPAAHMPYEAKLNGATLIEVNPHESAITPAADLWLPYPSGEAMPRVLAALTTLDRTNSRNV